MWVFRRRRYFVFVRCWRYVNSLKKKPIVICKHIVWLRHYQSINLSRRKCMLNFVVEGVGQVSEDILNIAGKETRWESDCFNSRTAAKTLLSMENWRIH